MTKIRFNKDFCNSFLDNQFNEYITEELGKMDLNFYWKGNNELFIDSDDENTNDLINNILYYASIPNYEKLYSIKNLTNNNGYPSINNYLEYKKKFMVNCEKHEVIIDSLVIPILYILNKDFEDILNISETLKFILISNREQIEQLLNKEIKITDLSINNKEFEESEMLIIDDLYYERNKEIINELIDDYTILYKGNFVNKELNIYQLNNKSSFAYTCDLASYKKIINIIKFIKNNEMSVNFDVVNSNIYINNISIKEKYNYEIKRTI